MSYVLTKPLLTPDQEEELEGIRAEAKIRHEKARKAAKRRGRVDFPALPFECSWAYEMQFMRERNTGMIQ